MSSERSNIRVTILMPCLNEAETLAVCIQKAKSFLESSQLTGEILIADNGSTDGSQKIAEDLGARVVTISEKGYGSALWGGIQAARGEWVIMGDSDDSYDFSKLTPFTDKLRDGCDLVMGNRFAGGIRPGAMPFLNRYLGNPVLSFVGRLFFRSGIRDFHCGLRGFRRDSILALNLRSPGMEFASEMIVKSVVHQLKITEVPTTLDKDGRSRPPHLRRWRDGWRHLRFLLLYSPRWLFYYPGIALFAFSFTGYMALLPKERSIGEISFGINTLVYSAFGMSLGFQLMFFGVYTHTFAIANGLLPADSKWEAFIKRWFNLEAFAIAGLLMVLIGFAGSIQSVLFWERHGFGELSPTLSLRYVIPSITMFALGSQLIFSSFFFGLLRYAYERRK